MTRRLRLCLLGALATVLVATTVPATAAARAGGHDDPASRARHLLSADASGRLALRSDASGRLRFAGTGAGASIDNPDVTAGASVASAARAHLDRYGAALGASAGTTYVRRATGHTVSGLDTVTYSQEIRGVPVIGGDVVVSMDRDRELRSVAASVSPDVVVGDATVSREVAARTARAAVARVAGTTGLVVSDEGRAVLDPTVVEVSLPDGPRTVWRFEVGDGAAVRQLVLVDDRTGRVLLRADLVEDADRVVCDRANVRGSDSTCTGGFARTETSAVSAQPDVNSAFDLSGAVSDFYQQVAGINLTQLLGVDVNGVRKLASSVRFCPPTSGDGACPYDNAFWNGQQMFYGEGWAGADDVVGHEMTHGFVDQYSELFYWGQSGAINESMADIIGEIIDHRHPSAGDSTSSWDLGEDSPVGTLRNLEDPTAYGQPDRMTSALWTTDQPDYADSGGVHTNSGVGNKTAYLISQGGTFNGQVITGIDGADAGLTKTGKLYVDVIERLSSGADYADLGSQLDQSCQDLVGAGVPGFTAATCTAVHAATLATELRSLPTVSPPLPDADTSCPTGTAKRVLYDSESGAPAAKVAVAGWTRPTAPGDSNATSGNASWFAVDRDTAGATVLQTIPIALPAGQPSYLSYQGWWVLDYEPGVAYDGGVVSVVASQTADSQQSSFTPTPGQWINGPSSTIASGFGNPAAGQRAFGGDSRGWRLSRLDLTQWAGWVVRPDFRLYTDPSVGFIGWYLDDITVYTCDPPPSAPRTVRVAGGANSMTVSWQAPATSPLQVKAYRVATPAGPVTVGRTATSVTVPVSTTATSFAVSVTAVSDLGDATGPAVAVRKVAPALRTTRIGTRVRFKGAVVAAAPVVGGVVKIQRRTSSGWTTVKKVTTRSDGSYVTKVRRRKKASYRALFMGTTNVVGTSSVVRRR